ncbi:hypothetical protein K1T71_010709 [Dendrolimus kikuchii]|uniref:Uncharacterized protein n=1 Tax=Dendrolimus kikuchii TaxID=765133 RepID=A0ACC1CPX6_9NEOP|nr:hypothetical protein K1T71_010709 [Dendrolimus kikuchii]
MPNPYPFKPLIFPLLFASFYLLELKVKHSEQNRGTVQFKQIHARGQVDLINMQTCPDRDFKYILNYHLTKFMILRPVHTKTAKEVTFLYFGCAFLHGKPHHSQSKGSIERANQDVQKILFAWMDDNKTNR